MNKNKKTNILYQKSKTNWIYSVSILIIFGFEKYRN